MARTPINTIRRAVGRARLHESRWAGRVTRQSPGKEKRTMRRVSCPGSKGCPGSTGNHECNNVVLTNTTSLGSSTARGSRGSHSFRYFPNSLIKNRLATPLPHETDIALLTLASKIFTKTNLGFDRKEFSDVPKG